RAQGRLPIDELDLESADALPDAEHTAAFRRGWAVIITSNRLTLSDLVLVHNCGDLLQCHLSFGETVYAMTVHKSQGSEFDKLLLLLPDRDAPVLTRELLYTGITRAKEAVEIWATEAVFRTAVSRRIERTSGLRDALWGG
ncbi:MAG: ATP-binding domain-containing protein, partial [Thermodesulfobacteriota bacterium]|nr:ATP-binding domain-containing protein [Thermodesulfobacteriota bacterium]